MGAWKDGEPMKLSDNKTLRALLSPGVLSSENKEEEKKKRTREGLKKARLKAKAYNEAYNRKREIKWRNAVEGQGELRPIRDRPEKGPKDDMLFHALRGGGFETSRRRH
jgi:hypothetical protein